MLICLRFLTMEDCSETRKKILCRLCSKENDIFFNIFDEQGIRCKMASVITIHFRFELNSGDEFTHICHTCWSKIETFHIYYLEIQEAQKILNSFNNNAVCSSPSVLQEESTAKYNYDDNHFMETIDDDAQCVLVESNTKEEGDQIRTIVKNKVNYESEPLSEKPSNKTEKPSNKTEKPSSNTEKPSSNTEKPSHKTEKLSNKTKCIRKRDSPLVLAEDDLIRNWCEIQCTKCPKLFTGLTFTDVKVHYHKEHDMSGFMLCCKKKLFCRSRALEHIARHINPNAFSCEKCNKTFSDKSSLLNHLYHHVSPDQRQYKCIKCDYSFVRRYQLLQHQKLRHCEEKMFFCEKCSKSFKTKSNLQYHLRGVHSTPYPLHSKVNHTGLICEVCGKTIKSKEHLRQHLSSHNLLVTKVQCSICSAWLKNQNSLRGHMARHIDALSIHECNECGKIVCSRDALGKHQRNVHRNTNKFACNLCVKKFKKSLSLKEHIASRHTGEVLYHCPFCSKTFNSNANLYSHKKRVHQNNLETLK